MPTESGRPPGAGLLRSVPCLPCSSGSGGRGTSSCGRPRAPAVSRLPAAQCPQRRGGGLVFREIKERRRKTVPLPPELVAALRKHRAAQSRERLAAANVWEDHDLVWCQENGRPIDSRADWQEWAGILAEAGIPHAGVHAMRHSAATIALDEGVALAVVQELLGHSDIRVTREYTHVSSPWCVTAPSVSAGRSSERSEPKNEPTTHDN